MKVSLYLYICVFLDVQLGTINSVLFNGSEYGVVAEKQGVVEFSNFVHIIIY